MSEQHTQPNDKNEDPCDSIDVMDLGGWTARDSDRMRETNSRQRLDRSDGDPHPNLWTRYDHG